MAIEVLDPTGERAELGLALAPRAAGLPGTVALLDIRKPRGDVLLDELEALLRAQGMAVERVAKPTFTKPAPADLRREVAQRCEAVIEALAD